jgi:hypothetical protein
MPLPPHARAGLREPRGLVLVQEPSRRSLLATVHLRQRPHALTDVLGSAVGTIGGMGGAGTKQQGGMGRKRESGRQGQSRR